MAEAAVGYLAVSLARGLSCLHQHRIVHRDLKPANVLLGKGGEFDILVHGSLKCCKELGIVLGWRWCRQLLSKFPYNFAGRWLVDFPNNFTHRIVVSRYVVVVDFLHDPVLLLSFSGLLTQLLHLSYYFKIGSE